LVIAGALFTSAEAAPVSGGAATKTLIDPLAMVEKTQVIVFGGRRWCYYWDAWNGPGWYWCGYGWRRGYGWGGGPGWHGWRYQSRDWHRRNRGWDRGGERRQIDRGRRGRDVQRSPGSDRRSIDRRGGGRDGVRGRSGGQPSFGGRGGGRSDGGRGASSGRSGGGGAVGRGGGGGGRGGGGERGGRN
jgi:uncharacterized membrane protein YgcG